MHGTQARYCANIDAAQICKTAADVNAVDNAACSISNYRPKQGIASHTL